MKSSSDGTQRLLSDHHRKTRLGIWLCAKGMVLELIITKSAQYVFCLASWWSGMMLKRTLCHSAESIVLLERVSVSALQSCCFQSQRTNPDTLDLAKRQCHPHCKCARVCPWCLSLTHLRSITTKGGCCWAHLDYSVMGRPALYSLWVDCGKQRALRGIYRGFSWDSHLIRMNGLLESYCTARNTLVTDRVENVANES